jgi:hypothetical protein
MPSFWVAGQFNHLLWARIMLSFYSMSRFFRPNLDRHGRFARGVIGALCLIAGIIVVDYVLWLGLVLVVAGLFAVFESLRGWCLMRACGIKTKI